MKTHPVLKSILLAALVVLLGSARAVAADNLIGAIELARTDYQSGRQTLLAEALQLTESEGESFWPLYRAYRAEMEPLGDSLVKLVLEYADVYPNVPDDRAGQLLKDYMALEQKLLKKRTWYLKRAAKSLPPAKVLRWAQVESRLDLALRLQLANAVPLVPVPQSRQ